jgi:hypothetical protein
LRAAALTSTLLRLRAASSAALPTMKVTREEYEPLSFGTTSLSPVTTRTRARSRPSTSATVCARMVVEPCPISAAPDSTTIEPSKSSLILTVACGSPVQFTGLEAPLM